MDPRTRDGSLIEANYCFTKTNHACEDNPVEARLRVSVESMSSTASSTSTFSRTAISAANIQSAIADTLEWWNVQADLVSAHLSLAYEELPEAELRLAEDGEYHVGMMTMEESDRLLVQGEAAYTLCHAWVTGGTVSDDCDVFFRTFRDELWGEPAGTLPTLLPREPLYRRLYFPWATDLPAPADEQGGGQMSFRLTLAHELGHVLGLDEGDVSGTLMRAWGVGDAMPLDLNCADRRAVLFLYCPDPGGEVSCTDQDVAAMPCDEG